MSAGELYPISPWCDLRSTALPVEPAAPRQLGGVDAVADHAGALGVHAHDREALWGRRSANTRGRPRHVRNRSRRPRSRSARPCRALLGGTNRLSVRSDRATPRVPPVEPPPGVQLPHTWIQNSPAAPAAAAIFSSAATTGARRSARTPVDLAMNSRHDDRVASAEQPQQSTAMSNGARGRTPSMDGQVNHGRSLPVPGLTTTNPDGVGDRGGPGVPGGRRERSAPRRKATSPTHMKDAGRVGADTSTPRLPPRILPS